MLNGYKTYLGLIVAAAPNIASLFGYDTAPGFSEQATALAVELMTILGLAVAAYGRAKAEVPGWFSKTV